MLYKLDVNKLVNVPTGLNNLKKVNDINVDKLKAAPVDLKTISDVVSKDVQFEKISILIYGIFSLTFSFIFILTH